MYCFAFQVSFGLHWAILWKFWTFPHTLPQQLQWKWEMWGTFLQVLPWLLWGGLLRADELRRQTSVCGYSICSLSEFFSHASYYPFVKLLDLIPKSFILLVNAPFANNFPSHVCWCMVHATLPLAHPILLVWVTTSPILCAQFMVTATSGKIGTPVTVLVTNWWLNFLCFFCHALRLSLNR